MNIVYIELYFVYISKRILYHNLILTWHSDKANHSLHNFRTIVYNGLPKMGVWDSSANPLSKKNKNQIKRSIWNFIIRPITNL